MDNITFLRVFLHNITPIQSAIGVAVIVFIIGIWFFSDGLSNKVNAFSFIITFASLCLLGYAGYHLLNTVLLPMQH